MTHDGMLWVHWRESIMSYYIINHVCELCEYEHTCSVCKAHSTYITRNNYFSGFWKIFIKILWYGGHCLLWSLLAVVLSGNDFYISYIHNYMHLLHVSICKQIYSRITKCNKLRNTSLACHYSCGKKNPTFSLDNFEKYRL